MATILHRENVERRDKYLANVGGFLFPQHWSVHLTSGYDYSESFNIIEII